MKRWIWLLTVPYVVTMSTQGVDCHLIYAANWMDAASMKCNGEEMRYDVIGLSFPSQEKETAEDLAAALNEAHAKRAQPKEAPQLEDVERCVGKCLAQMKDGTLRTGGGYKDPGSPPAYDRLPADKPFDYKSACGQPDCGVDPK